MSVTGSARKAGILLALAIVASSIAVRFEVISDRSGDYHHFLLPWYTFIEQHGGFRAMRFDFSNYNVPYLYLLVLATHLPGGPLYAIKTISSAFDVALAAGAYALLGIGTRPFVAAVARPRYALPAIALQCGSMLCYMHYFKRSWAYHIDVRWSALLVLIAAITAVILLVRDLRRPDGPTAAIPAQRSATASTGVPV